MAWSSFPFPLLASLVSPTVATILEAVGLLLLFSSVVTRMLPRRRVLRLPPGPRPLPLLGNFWTLLRSPKSAEKWASEYGPIMTVWLGSQCLIMITDPDIAHEALVGAGSKFSSRNHESSGMRFLASVGFRMINTAIYGDYWRSTRRNLAGHVLSKASWGALQPIREEEVGLLVELLRAEARQPNPGGVHLLKPLRLAVCSMFFRVCFGKRGAASDIEQLNDALSKAVLQLNYQIHDILPFLAPLLEGKHQAKIKAQLDKVEQVVAPIIAEHRALRRRGEFMGDYLDNLLALQESQPDQGLTDMDLLALVSELHLAGIDTSTLVTEWTMGELVANPEVQEKLHREIERVVGNRPVVEADLQSLPYLQAVTFEGLRMHPPLPNLIGHSSIGPGSKLKGYDIPHEAVVLVNMAKIQKDPRVWEDANTFRPERFMSSDGKSLLESEALDMKGIHGTCKINPFGAGRRICPGMAMGVTMVHHLLASLIQEFEFTVTDPKKGVDFTSIKGGISQFQTPLQVLIKERKPSSSKLPLGSSI